MMFLAVFAALEKWRLLPEGVFMRARENASDRLPELVSEEWTPDAEMVRKLAYSYSVIALAAKLASVDGEMNATEINHFMQLFRLPAHDRGEIPKLMRDAAKDNIDFQHYAARINTFYPRDVLRRERLVDRFLKLGLADGPLTLDEIVFIRRVHSIFGLSQENFYIRVRDLILPKPGLNPYQILGVKKNVSDVNLKKAYRQAVQIYHPDKVARLKSMPNLRQIFNERFRQVQQAYETIRAKRDFVS